MCIKPLSVDEGKVKINLDQQGNHYGINCDVRVDDGQLHTLIISRVGLELTLQIDKHLPLVASVYQNFSQLLDANIFLGGRLEYFQDEKPGLRGCFHQLMLDEREIDFEKDPIKTANIVPCQEYVT